MKVARGKWLGIITATGLFLLLGTFVAMLEYTRPHVEGDALRFDTFVELLEEGAILEAHIRDEDAYVVGTYLPDRLAQPAKPGPYNAPLVRNTQGRVLDLLLEKGVPTTVDQQVGKRVASFAAILLPGLIIVVLLVYLILSFRRGTGLFSVRSGARRITGEQGTARFGDVAGQEAAIAELREITEFLSDPDRYAALGAQVPKGVLLYGPPGCGKTLLARALAGESGANFYSISGSDFVELYVGVGASRVRELFREARDNSPAVIFIDELDSVGRTRAAGVGPPQGEQEQALNQILAEMDGFATSDGIIVVGATNRADVLDPALLRPGRFDRTVGLERPDEAGRLAILQVHAAGKVLGSDVDLATIAHRAIGLTGADLASVMNEGALLAARVHQPKINQAQLEAALQRILDAPERQRRLSLRDRSVAKRFTSAQRVTFAEVAGVDDAIAELAEVRDYLADPDRFARLGARVPRGILLSGPPGCGKTLLARAVAGEANAAFFSVAGSEFVEILVGEGASRVRELFAEAGSMAPAIVFIDEIDAIGARRQASAVAGNNRESEQTLNQILVELDGFEVSSGVIVIAATNRPDVLDPALVRPGRFDRQVAVTLPDRAGRRAILGLHTAGKRLAPDVDLDTVAALTRGFSGADLANVVNEAALLAARHDRADISMALVEEGIDRVLLGVASRGVLLTDEERRLIAYHEAGHALVARALPGAVLPHKLSISPRGATLGHCQVFETHDRMVRSKSMLLDQMAGLLGGRVAEELVFAELSAGSAGDLRRVGHIARQMVSELGMSDALGPLSYDNADGRVCSEEEARLIHLETRRLADDAYERARAVLAANRGTLDRLAGALLEHETITAAEIEALAGPRKRPRPAQLAAPELG